MRQYCAGSIRSRKQSLRTSVSSARTSAHYRSPPSDVAYELLYRSRYEREGAFFIDNALATADVVDAAFHRIGIQAVVGRTRALINVDADYLVSPRVERLPKETVMLELLESIDTDAQVVRRCRALKERGYALALDAACRCDKNFEPLLEFVDVVKVDVM